MFIEVGLYMGREAREVCRRLGRDKTSWRLLAHQEHWKGVEARDEDWEGKEGSSAGGTG